MKLIANLLVIATFVAAGAAYIHGLIWLAEAGWNVI